MLKKHLLLFFTLICIAGCQNADKNAIEQNPPTAALLPAASATFTPASIILTPVFLPSPTPLRTAPVIATAITNASVDDLPSPTASVIPASPTVPPLRKRGLDVPIGDYYKFVIHKAKEGENLEAFAAQYNTTVQAIITINYNLSNPPWADVLFVIPIGFSEVESLPVFVVYQIKEEERGISADGLAEKLRVNAFDLKYYNGMLAEGERPLVGDLILVPWSRPVQRIWRE